MKVMIATSLSLVLFFIVSASCSHDIAGPDPDIISGIGTLTEMQLAPEDSLYAFDFSASDQITEHTTIGDFVYDLRTNGNFLLQAPESVYEMIVDMGNVSLGSIVEAPESGYGLSTSTLIGHVYCIKTMEGHFAKIKIKSLEEDYVKFDWVYNSIGSRQFE